MGFTSHGPFVLVDMSDLDPVISFGKYRGLPFSQLEVGYLKWMLRQQSGLIEQGPWKRYAREELERRIATEVPVFPEGLDRPGPLPLEESRPNIPLIEKQYVVTEAAVGDASLLLLREFIRRLHQEVGIVDWLASLCEEVIKYGSYLAGDPNPSKRYYKYLGKEFEFEVRFPPNGRAYHLLGIGHDKLATVQDDAKAPGFGTAGSKGGEDPGGAVPF